MKLLSQLHQLPQHKEAENTPFVFRMRLKNKDEAPSKLDAIHHMQQLFHLYQAMEEKLKAFPDSERLFFFKEAPWANRSTLLKQDIMEMRQQLSTSEKAHLDPLDKVYPAFLKAVVSIQQATEIDLLAFLAVRCLGDVFGGQHLQGYTNKTFGGESLSGAFYASVKKSIRNITSFINDDELMSDEEKDRFIVASKSVFQFHIDLFEEMEGERPLIRESYLPSIKDCQRLTLWGAGTAVVVAAGVAISVGLSSSM